MRINVNYFAWNISSLSRHGIQYIKRNICVRKGLDSVSGWIMYGESGNQIIICGNWSAWALSIIFFLVMVMLADAVTRLTQLMEVGYFAFICWYIHPKVQPCAWQNVKNCLENVVDYPNYIKLWNWLWLLILQTYNNLFSSIFYVETVLSCIINLKYPIYILYRFMLIGS